MCVQLMRKCNFMASATECRLAAVRHRAFTPRYSFSAPSPLRMPIYLQVRIIWINCEYIAKKAKHCEIDVVVFFPLGGDRQNDFSSVKLTNNSVNVFAMKVQKLYWRVDTMFGLSLCAARFLPIHSTRTSTTILQFHILQFVVDKWW